MANSARQSSKDSSVHHSPRFPRSFGTPAETMSCSSIMCHCIMCSIIPYPGCLSLNAVCVKAIELYDKVYGSNYYTTLKTLYSTIFVWASLFPCVNDSSRSPSTLTPSLSSFPHFIHAQECHPLCNTEPIILLMNTLVLCPPLLLPQSFLWHNNTTARSQTLRHQLASPKARCKYANTASRVPQGPSPPFQHFLPSRSSPSSSTQSSSSSSSSSMAW